MKITSNMIVKADGTTEQNIKTGAGIKTAHIQKDAVTKIKIRDKSVTSSKIRAADGTTGQAAGRGAGIKTSHIQNNAVTEPKIKDDAVSSAKIKEADNTTAQDTSKGYGIKTGHIQNEAVTSTKIKKADGTSGQDTTQGEGIKTPHIQNNSVTTPKLADGSVTEPKLGANSVTSAKIKDGNVGTAELANGAVTEPKLGASSVTSSKIKDGHVGTAELANGAVTESKLGANSVTSSKIKDGNIGTAELANGAVTQSKLGADVDSRIQDIEKAANDYVDNLLVGSVAAFAMETPPDGWLECNAQTIIRNKYARLFERISITFGKGDGSTTFNVPDLRGEFIRGWAHDRNVDGGRIFGSFQLGQMQSHKHRDSGHSHNVVIFGIGSGTSPKWSLMWQPSYYYKSYGGFVGVGYANLSNPIQSTAGSVYHGNETRPRNVALLYCIKY
jgi:microcystin-dependent protein